MCPVLERSDDGRIDCESGLVSCNTSCLRRHRVCVCNSHMQ